MQKESSFRLVRQPVENTSPLAGYIWPGQVRRCVLDEAMVKDDLGEM